jgi:hypothetical protein
MAVYLHHNEFYIGYTCFVNGVKCRADKAWFGRIVIEKIMW